MLHWPICSWPAPIERLTLDFNIRWPVNYAVPACKKTLIAVNKFCSDHSKATSALQQCANTQPRSVRGIPTPVHIDGRPNNTVIPLRRGLSVRVGYSSSTERHSSETAVDGRSLHNAFPVALDRQTWVAHAAVKWNYFVMDVGRSVGRTVLCTGSHDQNDKRPICRVYVKPMLLQRNIAHAWIFYLTHAETSVS